MRDIKHYHFRQPKVLTLSFLTAMCERFGYYIIGFLLTLYLKNVYDVSDKEAFATFALFTAFGYLTPAIGGYLADNVIGIKRSLGLGLVLEGLGYVLLAIPTSSIVVFNLALGAIIVGAGLFKTAPTNILGRAYEENDPRIDSGFTLYYMGINVGSLGSSIIAGSIQESYGWHVPFAFAAVGLFLGLFWFMIFKRRARDYESKAGKKQFGFMKWLLTILVFTVSVALFAYMMSNETLANIFFVVGTVIVLFYFAYEIFISPRDEKIGILICLILILMAVVFFLLYYQLYTSMELFIERNVARNILGFEIPTVYFLGLNGLWIIVLSPIFASFYKVLRRRGMGFSITAKFPLGILLIGMCFFSLKIGCMYFAGPDAKISYLWVVLALFLYSSGELFTSALGVAMITRIAPARMYGVMMGAWYLIATALAADLSGYVADMASIPEEVQQDLFVSLGIYGDAFFKMGMIGLVVAILGFIAAPWLKRAARVE